jgi:hypothetical protein
MQRIVMNVDEYEKIMENANSSIGKRKKMGIEEIGCCGAHRAMEFIRKNGYDKFIKIADTWTMQYGRYKN